MQKHIDQPRGHTSKAGSRWPNKSAEHQSLLLSRLSAQLLTTTMHVSSQFVPDVNRRMFKSTDLECEFHKLLSVKIRKFLQFFKNGFFKMRKCL